MKWGVRRYQNPDGTRTSLGKKREKKSYRITQKKEGYNISPRRVKKNMNNMTDQELRTALNRINMQREVKQANPSIAKKGENVLKKYIAVAGLIVSAVGVTAKFAPGSTDMKLAAGKEAVNALLNSDAVWIVRGLFMK